jgi:hypothetical protein
MGEDQTMRAKAKPTVTLNTRIPAELHEQFARVLRRLAEDDDEVTIQWAVEQALSEWIDSYANATGSQTKAGGIK